jgi:hypothetical protein
MGSLPELSAQIVNFYQLVYHGSALQAVIIRRLFKEFYFFDLRF